MDNIEQFINEIKINEEILNYKLSCFGTNETYYYCEYNKKLLISYFVALNEIKNKE